MSKIRHVGQPNIADKAKFLERVEDALDRRVLTNDGPYVRQLEDEICAELGVKHCIAVANATLGLQFLAHLYGGGGEVIMPSFTFIATAHAALWEGCQPIFADIDPKTHCIDPAQVEKRITPRTRAICGVHLWGIPCDVDALEKIARDHGLRLYFDAAHAFGSGFLAGQGEEYRHKRVGHGGKAEVFSFHATKFVQAIEGGAITTNDDLLAELLRKMRNFGFTGDNSPPCVVGINAKMNEISAAMGLTNLERMDELLEVNADNYYKYVARLPHELWPLRAQLPGLWNRQYVVIQTDAADYIRDALWANRIYARRYFNPPCHKLPPYDVFAWDLPVTERAARRTLCLPTGLNVSHDDIVRICEIVVMAQREWNREHA